MQPRFLKPLHFCSAKIIPLVFDNSLSYYEQLCAFSAKLNHIIDYVNSMSLGLTEFYEMVNTELGNYVTMAEFNEFKEYVLELINSITNQGVGETIEPGTEYIIDDVTYTAGNGCEIFNSYDGEVRNKAAGVDSHAEGANTAALATGSHAEGVQTIATGNGAHAEGAGSQATAQGAHSEGSATIASATNAHAGGGSSVASGQNSFAHGSGTIAAESSQTAIGRYNNQAASKFLFVIGNGTAGDSRSDAFKVDDAGKIYVGNDLSGVDLKQFYDSFTVGSTDNNYVLTATYSGGSGSYSWKPSQGGGGSGTVITGSIIGINNDNDSWSFNHSPYYSRAKQQNNIVVLEIYGYYQSFNAEVVPAAEPRRVLIGSLSGVSLPDATIMIPALCTSATFSNGNSEFIFEITTTGAIYLNYTSMTQFDITQGNKLIANISYVVDTV